MEHVRETAPEVAEVAEMYHYWAGATGKVTIRVGPASFHFTIPEPIGGAPRRGTAPSQRGARPLRALAPRGLA